ncbi:hypothetical protein DFQ27_000560 [Actinomortierella ambigua]|uniref:Uncharacterized protein n=1 Tax=Actinomortierella ambigua TaxID=1343610 RepID=A0A9P6QEN0_9FUNG|nr:hypothetical protein DFQ27_000560 [Actinomortierella ambigua]
MQPMLDTYEISRTRRRIWKELSRVDQKKALPALAATLITLIVFVQLLVDHYQREAMLAAEEEEEFIPIVFAR